MCDRGEKSCPICTEETDLTDQQLKPCKYGYEICVWCWHHIMEMAEKDGTEGHCPACYSPYNKERIAAMAANCRRLVAEMNSQRKKKMQKLKPKAPEGRKHLNNLRVIQRNLVYIIGLPLNLANEDLLQSREYFGMYGKVLKVSISRTATVVIQHAANNSCYVFLNGNCLLVSFRLCFGTTKYCHAWLRNVPCTNRDCLYLHDYGSQEDSFTKDELVLAFASCLLDISLFSFGNDVKMLTYHGPVTSVVLGLLADDFFLKIENQVKGSCLGSGAGNSPAPPALTSWVMRVSGSLPPASNSSCSGNSPNRKVEASINPQPLVSRVACTEWSAINAQKSGEVENCSEMHSNSVLAPLVFSKHYIGGIPQTKESSAIKELIVENLPTTVMSNCETSLATFMGNDQEMVASSAGASFLELSKPCCNFNIDKGASLNSYGDVQGLCTGLSSVRICSQDDTCSTPNSHRLLFTQNSNNSTKKHHTHQDDKNSEEQSTSSVLWEDIVVGDLLKLNYEQQKCCKDFDNLSSGLRSPCLPPNVNQASHLFWQQDQICSQIYPGKPSYYFHEPLETRFGENVEGKENDTGVDKVASDMGESSIISSILSLELDAWEDSLVKLLGESDEQFSSLKAPTWWKVQDKNQSRFSFARQDDYLNEVSDMMLSFGFTGQAPSNYFASSRLAGSQDAFTGRFQHILPSKNSVELDSFVGSQFYVPSNFSVSKSHASTPPGFSVSSNIPPGFSCGRVEQNCNSSGKHLQQQHVPPSGNIGRMGDVEFNDPAILEVGKDMLTERMNNVSFDIRRTSHAQYSPVENEAKLKLLMQPSISSQNLRFPDNVGNIFSPQNDGYRISSRFLDQFQPNNPSIYEQLHSQQFSGNMLISNRQWGGWNDAKSFSGLAMSEVLNSERRAT